MMMMMMMNHKEGGGKGQQKMMQGRGTTQQPNYEEQPSTCPQPCEPLLMGWVAGASS